MAISPMSKDKVMRPSLIDAVDKINEIITAVNAVDMQGVDTRLTALETADVTMSGRIDGLATRTTDLETDVSDNTDDIAQIKTTLYTPLSQGGA